MKTILFLLMAVSLFALSPEQVENIKLAYKIGNLIKAKDGETFGYALSGIMLRESSAGKYLVGDDRYKNGKKKPLVDSSLGAMQIRLETARYVASKVDILAWLQEISDTHLMNMLKNNKELSLLVAGQYLKINYERALDRKDFKSNPYYRAISKYNGGWNNKKYYNLIKKDIQKIKREVQL